MLDLNKYFNGLGRLRIVLENKGFTISDFQETKTAEITDNIDETIESYKVVLENIEVKFNDIYTEKIGYDSINGGGFDADECTRNYTAEVNGTKYKFDWDLKKWVKIG